MKKSANMRGSVISPGGEEGVCLGMVQFLVRPDTQTCVRTVTLLTEKCAICGIWGWIWHTGCVSLTTGHSATLWEKITLFVLLTRPDEQNSSH